HRQSTTFAGISKLRAIVRPHYSACVVNLDYMSREEVRTDYAVDTDANDGGLIAEVQANGVLLRTAGRQATDAKLNCTLISIVGNRSVAGACCSATGIHAKAY